MRTTDSPIYAPAQRKTTNLQKLQYHLFTGNEANIIIAIAINIIRNVTNTIFTSYSAGSQVPGIILRTRTPVGLVGIPPSENSSYSISTNLPINISAFSALR